MKEKLTNNLLLKILSAIAAIVVWVVVVNIDNPTDTYIISGIPIKVLNEQSAIKDNNLTYEFTGEKTASVQVTVRRTDKRRVSAEDFEATVDLSQIYGATGSVAVNISVVNNKTLIRSWNPITRSVKIDVEEMQTREFEIQVEHSGTAQDSYTFSDETVSPSVVKVTAPESIMDTIDHAAVNISIDGLSDDVDTKAEIKLYTRAGREVETDDRVIMSVTEASVSMSAVKTNQISVDVQVTGQNQVADGYKYITYQCDPQSISVTGAKALIAEFDKLTIQEDLTGASGNITKTYKVSELLPSGLEVADKQPDTIKVTYQIEPLVKKTFRITGSQVEFQGAAAEFHYQIGDDNSFTVTLEGLSEDLEKIETKDLKAVLDVAGIRQTGVYEREPQVELPREYSAYFEVNIPTVHVIVTGENESSESSGESGSGSEAAGGSGSSAEPSGE